MENRLSFLPLVAVHILLMSCITEAVVIEFDEFSSTGSVSMEVSVYAGENSGSDSWGGFGVYYNNGIGVSRAFCNTSASASSSVNTSINGAYPAEGELCIDYSKIFEFTFYQNCAAFPFECEDPPEPVITGGFSSTLEAIGTLYWKLLPSSEQEDIGMPVLVNFVFPRSVGSNSGNVTYEMGVYSWEASIGGSVFGPYQSLTFCMPCGGSSTFPEEPMTVNALIGDTIELSYRIEVYGYTQDPELLSSYVDSIYGHSIQMGFLISACPCIVPNILDMTEVDAEIALNAADFVKGEVTYDCSDNVPAGLVMAQDPIAETIVDCYSEVDLVISGVIVPDVEGMTEVDAEIALNAADLVKGEVTYDCSDTVPVGLVMAQDPIAETIVDCYSEVDLIISGVIVPDVQDMTEVDAEITLNAADLVKGNVTYEYSDTVDAGLVMAQNPIAGTLVDCSSAVDLVISDGPAPACIVPNVLNMTKADAETALNENGLVKGKVTRARSDFVPVGLVMAQNPIAGTSVDCGSSVDLVISKRGGGPSPPGTIVYWSFDNPGDPGHDDSDNGHQLTIPGPWTIVPGPAGYAIALEPYGGGTNPGLNPWGPYTPTLGMDYPGESGFTVAFWAKIEEGKTAYVQDYWQDIAYGEVFNAGYQGSGEGITFMVRHDFSDSTPLLQVSSAPYMGQWIHLAGCYKSKGRKVRLYVNGRSQDQDTLPAAMRTILPPYMYVNGNWSITGPGTIDEVRIYNRALSAREIKELTSIAE